jgi:hypothetical protein
MSDFSSSGIPLGRSGIDNSGAEALKAGLSNDR